MMQNRASERTRQFEIEEEKEVPSEHLNDDKITTTRSSCNVTARKGFSFENMMVIRNQIESDMLGEEKNEVLEASFVVIDKDEKMLTDIEESELAYQFS